MSYNVIKYPDGSSYVRADVDYTNNIFNVNTYEDLWHLNQFVDSANSLGIKPNITIPNLIDAQADKRFNEGESSGLKLVCKFLGNMNADFHIFHPHNPEVVEALVDNVKIISNKDFILSVLRDIDNNIGPFEGVLMSSDAGGFKPLMKLCDEIGWNGDTYSASKSRFYDNGESKLIQLIDKKNFKGKDILIIDDICVYGGTFKGLSKLLRERNCGKLYLAVSHMTVQELGDDPVTKYFDNVFTTNSKFDTYYYIESTTTEYDPEGNPYDYNYRGIPNNLEVIKLF